MFFVVSSVLRYFQYSRDLDFLLFLDTLHIQIIWLSLLFLETFGLILDQVPSNLKAAGAKQGVKSLPVKTVPSRQQFTYISLISIIINDNQILKLLLTRKKLQTFPKMKYWLLASYMWAIAVIQKTPFIILEKSDSIITCLETDLISFFGFQIFTLSDFQTYWFYILAFRPASAGFPWSLVYILNLTTVFCDLKFIFCNLKFIFHQMITFCDPNFIFHKIKFIFCILTSRSIDGGGWPFPAH